MTTRQAPEETISPQADAAVVQSLFSRIAGVYDLLNSVLSFGLDKLWRRKLTAAVQPFPQNGTGRLLDLAAGTLEVSVGLSRRYPEHTVLALDFCRPMLVRGRHKIARCGGAILPVAADARRLPLPDACVDAVTISFGLRNIRPRDEAYKEALRVLAPGGKFCVLEFAGARDSIMFGLYNLYLHHVLPRIGRLVSRDKGAYRYLADTVAAYPSASELTEEMQRAGFSDIRHSRMTAGIINLHVGQKPLNAEPQAELPTPPQAG